MAMKTAQIVFNLIVAGWVAAHLASHNDMGLRSPLYKPLAEPIAEGAAQAEATPAPHVRDGSLTDAEAHPHATSSVLTLDIIEGYNARNGGRDWVDLPIEEPDQSRSRAPTVRQRLFGAVRADGYCVLPDLTPCW